MKDKILKINSNNVDFYKGTDIGKLLNIKVGKYYNSVDNKNRKILEHELPDNKSKRSVFLTKEGVNTLLSEIIKIEKGNLIMINKVHEILVFIGGTPNVKESEVVVDDSVKFSIPDELFQNIKNLEHVVTLQDRIINNLVSMIEKHDKEIKGIKDKLFILTKKGWKL